MITEAEYRAALDEIERMMDNPDMQDKMMELVAIVEDYEEGWLE